MLRPVAVASRLSPISRQFERTASVRVPAGHLIANIGAARGSSSRLAALVKDIDVASVRRAESRRSFAGGSGKVTEAPRFWERLLALVDHMRGKLDQGVSNLVPAEGDAGVSKTRRNSGPRPWPFRGSPEPSPILPRTVRGPMLRLARSRRGELDEASSPEGPTRREKHTPRCVSPSSGWSTRQVASSSALDLS